MICKGALDKYKNPDFLGKYRGMMLYLSNAPLKLKMLNFHNVAGFPRLHHICVGGFDAQAAHPIPVQNIL